MEYRLLGKTEIEVSSVGLGCWPMAGTFGGARWTGVIDEESIATIQHAETLGVNLLDSAEGYGAGHSEEIIGKALKGRRDRYVIATKVAPVTGDPDEGKARRRIVEACEGSLRRLQTDYIDIYQLHAIPQADTMQAVVDALTQLKQAGKILCSGISTNDTQAIHDLLALGDLSMAQVGFSIVNATGEEALQLAKEEKLGTLIRVPLAQGALTGKYFSTLSHLDPEDRRWTRFDNERAISALKKLSELLFLTKGGKRTMVQAALRFVLDTEGVTSVIPGAKNRRQLEENVGAVDVPPLTEEERAQAIAIADGAGWPRPPQAKRT